MAKTTTLKERGTGAVLYPQTIPSQVIFPDGTDLNDALAAQKQETEAALKDYAKKTDLSKKQDALTDSLDVKVSGTALTVTERAKRAVFDDLFLAAAGTWGKIDHTHVESGVSKPYYLNELWLTYEEAVAVYEAGAIDTPDCTLRYASMKILTNLPIKCGSWDFGSSTDHKFFVANTITDSDIEILNLNTNFHDFTIQYTNGSNVNLTAFSSEKLRKILGKIDLGVYVGENGYNIFGTCPLLEEVYIVRLCANLKLSGCPNINATSVRFMIERSYVQEGRWVGPYKTKGSITVTLHADTYAKVTSAVDDPEDEWYGLIDLAAAKNITFACA